MSRMIYISVVFAFCQFFSDAVDVSRAVFFSVGQGDSALVVDSGEVVVVDVGYDGTASLKLGQQLGRGKYIDHLVLSHFHKDHVGGLMYVLESYGVGKVHIPWVCSDSFEFEFLDGLYDGEVKMYSSGVEGDLSYHGPEAPRDCVHSGNINNASLVYSHRDSLLFLGDVESERELLLKDEIGSDYRVVKVAHHCSSSSSTIDMVQQINPDFAVCSYGENSYGHPSEDVVRRFEDVGSEVLHTIDGDITIEL